MTTPRRRPPIVLLAAAVASVGTFAASPAWADDASPAPILQYFESTYRTLESRMGDVFKAGYGTVYTPPPGRADSGNQSVGYDQFNRFDLGSAANPTLHGTEAGLRAAVSATHAAGLDYGVDFVMNHNGFSATGTAAQNNAFVKSGGYPGFATALQTTDPTKPGYNTLGYNAVDGDFHSAFAGGDSGTRLSGLIDIDHATNFQFVRNPTTVGDARNIPGQAASAANARFYTDASGASGSRTMLDPKTGETFTVHNFNTLNPSAGVAVTENALGLLMRNAQWLVQSVGVDDFRLDATKNMDAFVLNYFDRAVFGASTRKLLDGSQKQIFSWGEYYDGDKNALLARVRKDIDASRPNTVGGNRDTLDFPLFFALKGNLSSNGFQNDWRNVRGASLDYADDGRMNGSVGVKFAASHDDGVCDLSNVSYAYTLMTPGNAIVYDNPHQFGNGRDFPKVGRADALGGAYGDQLTKLVNLRNVYAQGNFTDRFISKESYAFERSKQSITLLSNRSDNFTDNRSFDTSFAAGTYLVELTGNAMTYGLPQVLQVQSGGNGGYVNASFLSNNGGDHGYLVYGLQAPQGTLAVGGVSKTIAGGSPTLSGTADQQAFQNATTRLTDLRVITGNAFTTTLNTTSVNLLGTIRDRDADGDNALLKLDGGLDVNGNGNVDFTTPGSVVYGFENFAGTKSTGYAAASGNGTYSQSIDATTLAEGYHYLTVRAFRHRDDGGPAVYQDFKEVLYVDRLKPVSSIAAADFKAFDASNPNNRDLIIRSTDQTATQVHVLANLGAALTDAQVLALVGTSNAASQYDRDQFKYGFFNVANGNNAYTVVTTEITGNTSVQRFTGISVATNVGFGLGDLTFDKYLEGNDLDAFVAVFKTNDQQFNPAADLNGDGMVSIVDWRLLGTELQQLHDSGLRAPNGTSPLVSQGTLDYYRSLGSQVPEPTTLAASLGLTMTLLRRRRVGR